jgi:hypothetical protein
MKIRIVVALMAIASAGSPAMAAGGVGEVGGVDTSNSGVPTGSTATVGGGGSSFAAPGGTNSGPGLLGDLQTLARSGGTSTPPAIQPDGKPTVSSDVAAQPAPRQGK